MGDFSRYKLGRGRQMKLNAIRKPNRPRVTQIFFYHFNWRKKERWKMMSAIVSEFLEYWVMEKLRKRLQGGQEKPPEIRLKMEADLWNSLEILPLEFLQSCLIRKWLSNSCVTSYCRENLKHIRVFSKNTDRTEGV